MERRLCAFPGSATTIVFPRDTSSRPASAGAGVVHPYPTMINSSSPALFWRASTPLRRLVVLTVATVLAGDPCQAADEQKPMNFMDILGMRTAGSPSVSTDGKWMLYTLGVPDWKAAKTYTDIYLVSVQQGVASTRRMTFTRDKNETSPRWSRDGKIFAFLSNREAPATATAQNQLYVMSPDGGEARCVTDFKEGVISFAFSKDGRWLAFSAGKEEEQQIWLLEIAKIESEPAKQLTRHNTPVSSWQFSPDSRRILFLAPDTLDKSNKERKEKKFDVRIRNESSPPVHLWSMDLETRTESRLTSGTAYSVSGVTLSKDSKWIGFHGIPNDRYLRSVTDAPGYADLYLLEVASGNIERLTINKDIAESALSFSPDSSLIAYSASDDFKYFHNGRLYVRAVDKKGKEFRKLGDGFDGDVGTGFWSRDNKSVYFNEGVGATAQLCAVSIESGKVVQVTREAASLTVSREEESERLLIHFSDPVTPSNYYSVDRIEQLATRSAWRQLTDSNPQFQKIALGRTELIQWKSSDGKTVEGILVKPVGYEPGKRYPLVVQIHGGPQSAVLLNFNANYSYFSHVFAGAGYACLLPNYRGSSNYGEKHKMQISGDYFRQGYDDILSGVDHLIASGLTDGNRMGVMGWSAGGHWSNWILTHTDRFKAISSGAGVANWISMYAQSDTQRVREFYLGGVPPYDNFDEYWKESPLKYIKNAKTPTLIHVVDGDPRVPRPQSEELHMALKKLGVPTELLVYPGTTHGITEPRNQLVKMVTEFNWMEKYVQGKDRWFDWKDLLATLKDSNTPEEKKKEAEETVK
jgi:dipeptidyl aminopeptidase/acylaminoacyl peptidase